MLRGLLILAILVPGTYLAVRNRYVALLMYLWFALFRPQDWLWMDITSLRLSLVLGAILLVPAVIAAVYPNFWHPLSIGMILFLSASLVAQLGATDGATGWVWIEYILKLFLACMMLITLASDEKRLWGVIAVLACSLGFHAAKAGLAYALGGGGERFGAGLAGAFDDNNAYALGTVMITPLLLATAQNLELIYTGRWLPWLRRGFYASILLCSFAVIGTFSRGGFLALSAAVFTYVMLQRRRVTSLAAMAAVTALFLLVVPIPKSYLERVNTIRTYDEIGDDSALSRPHFWQVGILMALDRPLGIGLRQYEKAYDRYDFLRGRYGVGRAVHSSHIQVLAEIGFIGALVWFAMFGYATVVCLRIRAMAMAGNLAPAAERFLFTVSNALLTSMVSFLVGGAFLSLALNDITWLTFGMVAALDLVSRQIRDRPALNAPSASARRVPLAFQAVASYASSSAQRAGV